MISRSFKVPTLVKKQKSCHGHGLPTFDWKKVTNQRELGVGSFGSIYLANYEEKNAVVKKLRGESDDAKRRFLKEAEMLNAINHPNIPKFFGFSDTPSGLMMEYVAFDFAPFGLEKTVSTLEDFYHFVDCEFDFESFDDVIIVCLRDVLIGLNFLHQAGIAHRDLKPSNILVSNQHYCDRDKLEVAKEYEYCPIICKVADFGLSRSLDTQTQSILQSRTEDICRGTPVYMAPEIHMSLLTAATQADLKKMDIWSLGLLAYALVNPNLTNPYRKESEQLGVQFNMETMKRFMQAKQLPGHDTKYESFRVTRWWQAADVFSMCAKFDPNSRPSVADVLSRVKINDPEASLVIQPLGVSQNSALVNADINVAHQLQVEMSMLQSELELQAPQPPLNDGTNACTFLALAICDTFFNERENGDQRLSWPQLARLADDIITELPRKINGLRDSSETYEASEAKAILASNRLLSRQYDLSEECISGSGVFSESGRNELLNAFNSIPSGITNQVGVYTCSPYTFMIGLHDDSFFLVDTHPIAEELGGNGNGVLVATTDRTSRSCSLVTQWILKRLRLSGVDAKTPQSLAWLNKTRDTEDNCRGVQEEASPYGVNANETISEDLEPNETCNGSETSGSLLTVSRSHDEQADLQITAIHESVCISSDSSSEKHKDTEVVLFKGDPLTPVFEWASEAYSLDELVKILLGEYATERLCVAPPVNVAHNVAFLVNNASMKNKNDIKCDDMGAWIHTGSPKRSIAVTYTKEGKIKEVLHSTDASNAKDANTSILKRIYYINKSSMDVRKIVSTLQDCKGVGSRYTLVQYLFKDKEHEVKTPLPHGNSKKGSSYRRMFPSTRTALQASTASKKETPKQLLDNVYRSVGDVTEARSLGQLPRGPRDVYNARFAAKKETKFGQNEQKSANINEVQGIWQLLEKAKREEEEGNDSAFIRECRIHPDFLVVLASNRQLQDLKHFCTNADEFCVLGVDPTFNIFEENISLTVMTYRNLKLHHNATQKSPVFIGPLLMHQRKDWKTYSRFANSLIAECPDLEGVLACGTDGEKALIDGLKRNFRFALLLRCFIHFKDNVKRELERRGISPGAKKIFLNEIFGKQEEQIKYTGLVDCDSEEEFQTKLESLEERWNAREAECGGSTRASTFYEWFCKEKATHVKESMLKPIRIEAGLGNPPNGPKEYTNNDPEAANFMIKHALKFDPKKPHEFVDEMRNIVETQFRNEDRAVFGKGPYEVRSEFQHLAVDESKWSELSPEEKRSKIEKFVKSGMECKKDLSSKRGKIDTQSSSSAPLLSVTASGTGISTVPSAILQTMFRKANDLVRTPNNAVPKPGASDGSFVVAGFGNTIHCVTPGKGGCLKCDRSCVNFSTDICEHILAVAHVRGSLQEYLQWYKRSRRGPKVLKMALGSGPKNAGKKPSKRKKTNKVKATVTEVVDILQENDSASAPLPTLVLPQQPLPAMVHPPAVVVPPQQPLPARVHPPALLVPSQPNLLLVSPVPIHQQHLQSGWQSTNSPSNPGAASQHTFPSPPASSSQGTSFRLKWVGGTTVSRCYGCNGEIKNPPESVPDDLAVVYRDIRQFRERNTGQVRFTTSPQNVHFHLRISCIRARYPNFPGASALVIPDDFPQYFHYEHIQRLNAEFGWIP